MARLNRHTQILAAAECWKDRCLLGEGSLFNDWSLWTRPNFQELHSLFVENPDESKDPFLAKLQRQLSPGSPDAKCLWAEMTWLYRLIQDRRSMKPETKRDQIAKAWKWSGRDFPEDHELLSDRVLGAGVINPGTGYIIHAWMEFRFFVAAMIAWFSLDRTKRESLLGRPWHFASWLDATEFAHNRMFRHAILFLLFPDQFEPIVSTTNKKKIVSRLHRGDRIDDSNQVEVDRAILAIRPRLEDKHPGEELHFYDSLIKKLWKEPGHPKQPENGKTVKEKKPKPYGGDPSTTYTPDDAHQDLFIPRSDFDRLLISIKSRKNLILQGPPGTGKTFIARRIAWCLIGREDDSPIEMVQFHQSYAYEDFVQGYRPTDIGGFELKNGVFHRFCERARLNPDTPHVFIIDEINRGNLSRIFGELLMLIERDKRSTKYAVALTYSDQRFHVPENVFILGMMNTADRSLALVDYALRRRFAFETLEPAYGKDCGRTEFENYLTGKRAHPELARRISDRMDKLNETIRNDKELGRGFQIGHSYFVPGDGDTPSEDWYKHIVDTQIAPLLREYWFDSPEDTQKEVARLTADA